jgi:hypothetical protein
MTEMHNKYGRDMLLRTSCDWEDIPSGGGSQTSPGVNLVRQKSHPILPTTGDGLIRINDNHD